MRIEKAVMHPDSYFCNKKQQKQLTSMCLQLPLPNEQQQEVEEMSTVPAAVAVAQKVQVKELKTILKKAGLVVEGFKMSLLQRVQKASLVHHLGDPRAAETLLKNYEALHGRVGAEDASADEEEAAAEPDAESDAEPDIEQGTEEVAANGEDSSAEPAAEETAAEPVAETGAEPGAEIALAHISNFYSTSTKGSTGRTWGVDAWQAMVESNCPELHHDMGHNDASFCGKFLANRLHI